MTKPRLDKVAAREQQRKPRKYYPRPPQTSFLRPEIENSTAVLEGLQQQYDALSTQNATLQARLKSFQRSIAVADEELAQAMAEQALGRLAQSCARTALQQQTTLEALPPPEQWTAEHPMTRWNDGQVRYLLYQTCQTLDSLLSSKAPADQILPIVVKTYRFGNFQLTHNAGIWTRVKSSNYLTGELDSIPSNWFNNVAAIVPLENLPSSFVSGIRKAMSEYNKIVKRTLRRRAELQSQLAQLLPRPTNIGELCRQVDGASERGSSVNRRLLLQWREPQLGTLQQVQLEQQQQQRQQQQLSCPPSLPLQQQQQVPRHSEQLQRQEEQQQQRQAELAEAQQLYKPSQLQQCWPRRQQLVGAGQDAGLQQEVVLTQQQALQHRHQQEVVEQQQPPQQQRVPEQLSQKELFRLQQQQLQHDLWLEEQEALPRHLQQHLRQQQQQQQQEEAPAPALHWQEQSCTAQQHDVRQDALPQHSRQQQQQQQQQQDTHNPLLQGKGQPWSVEHDRWLERQTSQASGSSSSGQQYGEQQAPCHASQPPAPCQQLQQGLPQPDSHMDEEEAEAGPELGTTWPHDQQQLCTDKSDHFMGIEQLLSEIEETVVAELRATALASQVWMNSPMQIFAAHMGVASLPYQMDGMKVTQALYQRIVERGLG